jgi:hypothetical protein
MSKWRVWVREWGRVWKKTETFSILLVTMDSFNCPEY